MELLSKLKASEPVRLYLYPILVILIGYGVYRGVVDDSVATLVVIPALGVLLGVTGEAARAKVTPQVKIPEIVSDRVDSAVAGVNDQIDSAVAQARSEVQERFGEQGTQVLDAVTNSIEGYIGRHRAG